MFRNALKIINSSIIIKNKQLITNNLNLCLNNTMKFSTSTTLRDKEYTESGEWILKVNDCYKIGLSENSASELGELVYLEFDKDITETVEHGEDLAIIESVKASASVLAPFDCVVVSHNDEIVDALHVINENSECEDSSWILKVRKI
jgi:glycine cleavage system H protein